MKSPNSKNLLFFKFWLPDCVTKFDLFPVFPTRSVVGISDVFYTFSIFKQTSTKIDQRKRKIYIIIYLLEKKSTKIYYVTCGVYGNSKFVFKVQDVSRVFVSTTPVYWTNAFIYIVTSNGRRSDTAIADNQDVCNREIVVWTHCPCHNG